jgi:transcriptional regulator with XRE-family HTH domain
MATQLRQKDIALGKRVQRLRKQSGKSQEQIAERTRLTQTYISLLETGKRRASMKTLEKIASAIGVKVRDLLPY